MAPAHRSWRKPSHRSEDPTQPKININKLKKKKPFHAKHLEELDNNIPLTCMTKDPKVREKPKMKRKTIKLKFSRKLKW